MIHENDNDRTCLNLSDTVPEQIYLKNDYPRAGFVFFILFRIVKCTALGGLKLLLSFLI